MIWDQNRLQKAFNQAKTINAHHGKSYFFASRLFPIKIRDAVHILYAFFRLPDEIVDSNAGSTVQIETALQKWEQTWQKAYKELSTDNDILYASSYVFHTYQIPFAYSISFLKAMKQDISKSTYKTYSELEDYMYGSAGVVGLMLSYVIGFQTKQTLDYALKLGYAMQLTNCLRDIKEDYVERKRIYMPQTELKQFGLTNNDIAQENFSAEFNSFMQWQIARARKLYKEADTGIKQLNKRGQLAVLVASRLYEAILD